MSSASPPIQLGTAQWGLAYGLTNTLGRPTAPAEIAAIIRLAHEAGIRELDTARAYGKAEAAIGSLKVPEGWSITTKLDPAANTAEAALASVNASLAALARDRLDTLLLHRAEQRHADGDRLWQRLLEQQRAGVIGRLGLSAVHPEEAWGALQDPEVEVLQVASSLFDQRLHRQGFFVAARAAGKRVVIRSLLLQGVLFLDAQTVPGFLADLRQPLAELQQLAAHLGVERGALALAFARLHHGTMMTLGCESPARLVEYLGYWRQAAGLEDEAAAFMADLSELPPSVLNPALWPAKSP